MEFKRENLNIEGLAKQIALQKFMLNN